MACRALWVNLVVLAACRASVGEPVAAPVASTPAVAELDAEFTSEPGPAPTRRTEPPLTLTEVAPGVFAALQPAARRFAAANAAVIVDRDSLLAVDMPQRVTAARWLTEQFATQSSPERWQLVTTHWHLDHTLGTAVVQAELERTDVVPKTYGHADLDNALVAEATQQLQDHRAALARLLERGGQMLAAGVGPDGTPLTTDEQASLEQQLHQVQAQASAANGVRLIPPSERIRLPTTVTVGARTLELIPLRAHTAADLVVYIRDAGVLISGDVVDEIPFGGHGYPRQWLAALRQLQTLTVKTIIPGHGGLMGPERIALLIALWSALLEQAEAAVDAEQTAAERYAVWRDTETYGALREALVSDAVSERNFEAFMPEALDRAMADLRGELGAQPSGPRP